MQIYYDDITSLKCNNFDEIKFTFKNETLFKEFKPDNMYNIRYPLLDNIRGAVVNSCHEYQNCQIQNVKNMTITFKYTKKIYISKRDRRNSIISSI